MLHAASRRSFLLIEWWCTVPQISNSETLNYSDIRYDYEWRGVSKAQYRTGMIGVSQAKFKSTIPYFVRSNIAHCSDPKLLNTMDWSFVHWMTFLTPDRLPCRTFWSSQGFFSDYMDTVPYGLLRFPVIHYNSVDGYGKFHLWCYVSSISV